MVGRGGTTWGAGSGTSTAARAAAHRARGRRHRRRWWAARLRWWCGAGSRGIGAASVANAIHIIRQHSAVHHLQLRQADKEPLLLLGCGQCDVERLERRHGGQARQDIRCHPEARGQAHAWSAGCVESDAAATQRVRTGTNSAAGAQCEHGAGRTSRAEEPPICCHVDPAPCTRHTHSQTHAHTHARAAIGDWRAHALQIRQHAENRKQRCEVGKALVFKPHNVGVGLRLQDFIKTASHDWQAHSTSTDGCWGRLAWRAAATQCWLHAACASTQQR